jgi:putative flippase GtrA
MQILRFCLVGTVVFLVEALVLVLLVRVMMLSPESGRVLSFPLAVCLAWYLNRRFTFYSRSMARLRELGNYALTNMLGLLVNLLVYYTLVAFMPIFPFYELLALAAGSVAGLSFNFLMAKWWVFRHAES